MGGSKSPAPDPNIGKAALKSAELGEQMLGWLKDQSEVTNVWAAEDRGRWQDVFKPLQDQYISEAKDWNNEGRKEQRANSAIADTRLQARIADGTRLRQAMAMGVNPASGAFQDASAKGALDAGLAAVGAGNIARRQVDQEAETKIANAINMGSGLAVNPATSMGLSNSAISAGGSGAMQGYGQQGSLLNTQFQQQMQAHQANQSSLGGLFSGIGAVAGMLSSKKAKTDKKPVPEGAALGAVRDMPIEQWRYKEGTGQDTKTPMVGTYAEDFTKATGQGNGKLIPIQTAIGITMGAVKDLDRKLSRIEARAA